MNKRTCTMPGCDKAHRARGLCGTHYNQQNPNRYRMVTIQCAHCGDDCEKEAGRASKYAKLFCSLPCRDAARRQATQEAAGVWPHSPLPATHWARWYGRTSPWAPPKAPRVATCGWCGDHFNTLKEIHTYCTPRCSNRASKARRRAREVGAPGEYSWSEVIGLHLLADRRCSYCDIPNTNPEPDHVVPLSRGGRNDLGNILPCCQRCNGDKGDMTLTEWSEYRARRGKQPVRVTFERSDTRFRHLIEGVATGMSHRIKTEFERAA